MPKNTNQKQKILRLMEIFFERTDREHPMTVPMLIDALSEYQITTERKSVYDDISTLKAFGMDIRSQGGKGRGYYLGERKLGVNDVEVLIDLVHCSTFLTSQKGTELIQKLEGLASRGQRRLLQRRTRLQGRKKTENGQVYFSLSLLHQAIEERKAVRFYYAEYRVRFGRGNSILREINPNRPPEEIFPTGLFYEEDTLFCVGVQAKTGGTKKYLVDRMERLQLSLKEKPEKISGIESMAGREEKTIVKLRVSNELAGELVQRYGSDLFLFPSGERHFTVNIPVVPDAAFLGWVFGFGGKAMILAPHETAERMRKLLEENLSSFGELSQVER